MTGAEPCGIPWVVSMGFVRLMSNPRVVRHPERPEHFVDIVRRWHALPSVRSLGPGMRHWDIVGRLFRQTGGTSRLCTDVHLAALAIEHGATLFSNDVDFARFEGLDWKNPLD